jgi:SNF2 family DNA or RNA helicase
MIDYTHLEEHLHRVYEVMHPYQRAAVAMGRKRRRALIELKMGTGKTLIGLTTIFCFRPKKILVLCSINAFWTWQKEIDKWFPSMLGSSTYTVVRGTAAQRQKLWATPSDIYVTTYDTYRIDSPPVKALGIEAIIADELHRIGKYKRGTNPRTKKPYSQKYKALLDLLNHTLPAVPFVGLSGGLAKVGPHDLWHYLHLLDPRFFSSYWRFVEQFCEVIDGMFGKEIVGPRNEGALADAVRPYLFRSDNAERFLPQIIRDYLPVEMNIEQRKLYNTLEQDRFAVMDSGSVVWAANSLTLFLRHRQLLACPRILGGTTSGAALDAVVDKAQDEDSTHFVVYTMFTKAIPHIRSFLEEKGLGPVYTLQGGASPEEVRAAEEGMRRNKGIAVCSILFAQSFEFPSASLAFFVGCDWDVQNNEQALHRQRRLTSKEPLRAYYVRHFDTCEDVVFESILDPKARAIRQTYKDMNDFAEYWKPRPKHGNQIRPIDVQN